MTEESIAQLLISLLVDPSKKYMPDERHAEIFFILAQLKITQQQMWTQLWYDYLHSIVVLEGAVLGCFTRFLQQVFEDIKSLQEECKPYYINIFKQFLLKPQQIFNTLSDGMTFSDMKKIQQLNNNQYGPQKQNILMNKLYPYNLMQQQANYQTIKVIPLEPKQKTMQLPQLCENQSQRLFDYKSLRIQGYIQPPIQNKLEEKDSSSSDQTNPTQQRNIATEPDHNHISYETVESGQKLQNQALINQTLTIDASFPFNLIPPPPPSPLLQKVQEQNILEVGEQVISESLPSLPRDDQFSDQNNQTLIDQDELGEIKVLRLEVEEFRKNFSHQTIIPINVFSIKKAKKFYQQKQQSILSQQATAMKKTKQRTNKNRNRNSLNLIEMNSHFDLNEEIRKFRKFISTITQQE